MLRRFSKDLSSLLRGVRRCTCTAPALIILLVLLMGAALAVSPGHSVAGEPNSAPPPAAQAPVLAVLPIAMAPGTRSLLIPAADAYTELLRQQLATSDAGVTARRVALQALAQTAPGLRAPMDAATAAKVGRLLAANWVIFGTLGENMDRLILTLTAIRVPDSADKAEIGDPAKLAQQQLAAYPAATLDMEARLAKQLATGLHLELDLTAPATNPKALAALMAFGQAVQFLDVQEPEMARPLLDQAVELEPWLRTYVQSLRAQLPPALPAPPPLPEEPAQARGAAASQPSS